MSNAFRTPLANTRGLGSAKEGVGHYIDQRVSAIALIILVPWFVFSAILSVKTGYAGALDWMAKPWNAIGLILLSGAAFFHMRLGMQVVIEDYIHKPGTKQALLILNSLAAIALFAATAMSVLKIWIGS